MVAAVLIFYVVILWVSAVVWTYRDVRMRTRDPFSQAVAVILVGAFNLPGLLIYLVIRPQETLADAYERSLEAESMLHDLQGDPNSCQTCRRPVEADFQVCPFCRTVLREPCRNCGRAIRTNWQACAYCAADRLVPAAQRPVQSRQAPLAEEPVAPPPMQAPPRQRTADRERERAERERSARQVAPNRPLDRS
jgi:hypothetical protein